MSNMYNHLKRMMGVAEQVGAVSAVNMGEFLNKYDRIFLKGVTVDGRAFEMTLEVEKEVQKDA